MRPLLRRPVALAYHGVAEADDRVDPARLLISPANLEAHVRLLQRRGYRFLTAEELLDEGGPGPPGTAAITFDDGFRNWVTEALPLLRRLGVRATFYVCPGLWGGEHWDVPGKSGRLLEAGEARALHEAGMELGSHTLSHPDLRLLGDESLARELSGSKTAVEELTGRPCRTLAYPFGLYDGRVVEAAGAAGYELAFGWLPGPWRPLTAPRLPGPPRHGAGRLALKLLGLRRPRPRPGAGDGVTGSKQRQR